MKIFRMNKNRKGFFSHIQMAVLAVVVIIIFSLFLHKVYVNMKDRMSVNSCKSSIEAHSIVASTTGGDIYTDIKCPTNEITIKHLKTAKPIIAEDMHRCWYVWGQGDGRYFEGDGTFCHVCSIYTFGDKGKTVEGLMQYLHEERMPAKYPSDIKGITYAQYLAGYTSGDVAQRLDTDINELSKTDTINTSKRYATLFVYASGKDSIQKIMESGGRSTVGAIGMFGTLGGGTAILVGTFIASNPVGWIVGGAIAAGAGVAAIWQALKIKEPEWMAFIIFTPYDEAALNDIGCQKFAVNQMSNTGK
ncbi:MAG: hypothetical protein ACP5NW_03025 [Candidatus Woesearchaeota archaeon]